MKPRTRKIIDVLVFEFALLFALALIGIRIAQDRIYHGWPALDRWSVPGEHTTHFEKAGSYLLCFEHKSHLDSIRYRRAYLPSTMRLTMIDTDSGDTVTLRKVPASRIDYAIGGRAGQAMFAVQVPRPGAYLVKSEFPPAESDTRLVFTFVSQREFFVTITVFLIIVFGLPLLLAIPVIYVYVMSERAASKVPLEAPPG